MRITSKITFVDAAGATHTVSRDETCTRQVAAVSAVLDKMHDDGMAYALRNGLLDGAPREEIVTDQENA